MQEQTISVATLNNEDICTPLSIVNTLDTTLADNLNNSSSDVLVEPLPVPPTEPMLVPPTTTVPLTAYMSPVGQRRTLNKDKQETSVNVQKIQIYTRSCSK